MDLMSLVPNETLLQESMNKSMPIEHVCRVAKVEDEIDGFIKGRRAIDDFRRWIIRKSVLTRNHPTTRYFIKSSAAVDYEISRHIRSYSWMIYPFSEIRNFWDIAMLIFTTFALIIVPLVLAYDFDRSDDSFAIVVFIDLVFLLDVAMTFLTGHYDDTARIIILDRKIVAGIYFRGFFVLDLLTSTPVELFHVLINGRVNANWYCTVVNLTKLFRLRNIVCYSRKLRHNYKIFEMSMIMLLTLHWATCLELYVALVGRELDRSNANRGSWFTSERMNNNATNVNIYVASANRAATSLVSSAHYLDVKTPEDILLNLALTVVGRIGFIYIIAQFLQLMTSFHSTRKKSLKPAKQLEEYMRYKELPFATQRRLLDYSEYRSKKSFDRDKYIISNVSPCLREELLLHNYSRLVGSVEFFRYMPRSLVALLVGFLHREIFLTSDIIVKSGTIGDALLFVASGTVAVYTDSGNEVCHLEDGSHFGDLSLVMENEQRFASVVAAETCEIWILKRHDFLQCIAPYPELLNQLQKIAIERLEKKFLKESIRLHDGSKAKTTLIRNEKEDNEEK